MCAISLARMWRTDRFGSTVNAWKAILRETRLDDRACPLLEMSTLSLEGVVHGLGAYAHSGYGDGIYPVFAGHRDGQLVKLRLALLGERPQNDATVPVRASICARLSTAGAEAAAARRPRLYGIVGNPTHLSAVPYSSPNLDPAPLLQYCHPWAEKVLDPWVRLWRHGRSSARLASRVSMCGGATLPGHRLARGQTGERCQQKQRYWRTEEPLTRRRT